MSKSSIRNNRQVVFFLAYHKTASKWIWANFFTAHYPNQQINILTSSTTEVQKVINEDMNSSPFILRQRIDDGSMGEELHNLAEALERACSGAKFVVSIRSQRSILPSHYGQYVKNGGRLSFRSYLSKAVHAKWHYFSTLKSLQDRFGDRLLVYLFEEFRDDPYATLCRLRDFIGAPADGLSNQEIRSMATLPPVNPQRNDLVVDAMLALNRLRLRHRKNAIIPTIALPGHDHIVVDIAGIIARIYKRVFGRTLRYRNFNDNGILKQVYGEENVSLAKLLDRPLHDFGYPI